MRVKLRKVGNSLTVTIPYEIAEELHLSEGAELEVLVHEDSVVLESARATWDRITAPLRQEAAEKGITEDDILNWVMEERYGESSE